MSNSNLTVSVPNVANPILHLTGFVSNSSVNSFDITRSWLTITEWGGDKWKQALCANPPQIGCPGFGLCPNPDITGYGQQVSLYVTEVVHLSLLAFWPDKVHTSTFSHSVLVLSLQITTLFELFTKQLTYKDAVFVLVLVASPLSIYLWITRISRLIRELFSPIERRFSNRRTRKERHDILETYGTRLTILTFLLEIAQLIAMYFVPRKFIYFSQPDCARDYGPVDIIGILWFGFFLLQLVVFLVVSAIYFILFRILGNPSDPKRSTSPDIIGWFEESIRGAVSGAVVDDRSVLVPCCLAILQIQTWLIWLPLPQILAACQWILCVFGILWTSLIRPFRTTHFFIFLGLAVVSFPAFLLPVTGRVRVQRPHKWSGLRFTIISLSPFAPFASDFLIIVLSTSSLWKSRDRTKSIKMFVYCVFFALPLLGLKVVQAVIWYLYNVHFHSETPSIQFGTIVEKYEPLFFSLFTFTSLQWMFVSWLSVTRWVKKAPQFNQNESAQNGEVPSSRHFVQSTLAHLGDAGTTPEKNQIDSDVLIKTKDSVFKYILTGRAYLLKFGLLVAFPTALWISAVRATGYTLPGATWTFGQTFSIIISFGSIVEILVDLHVDKGPQWFHMLEQVLKSKEIDWNTTNSSPASNYPHSEVPSIPKAPDVEAFVERKDSNDPNAETPAFAESSRGKILVKSASITDLDEVPGKETDVTDSRV